ncbi:hypothetical protein HYC85_019721 [Camellia sinensis]|uniref:Uncharacterized protein n=1 Tax=Camellia sinensis TaxID=4442 RepID=A0A7J7GMR8_CAMSI|nr:hypothetical protein HYC85_019721 [Camellia sinensis]
MWNQRQIGIDSITQHFDSNNNSLNHCYYSSQNCIAKTKNSERLIIMMIDPQMCCSNRGSFHLITSLSSSRSSIGEQLGHVTPDPQPSRLDL